jgi:rsbT antagonist protein RsbS
VRGLLVLHQHAIPLILLGHNLIVSIQTDLEDNIALRLRDDIAHEIVRTGATGLVIDVTAIDIMDSYTARVIDDIGRNSALMGARSVLVGLRPAIAITLVEMGMEMGNVRTALNLEAGLALLDRDEVATSHDDGHGKEAEIGDDGGVWVDLNDPASIMGDRPE